MTVEQDDQLPFYRFLGVSESASEEEITAAYREAVKEYHPDSGTEPDRDKFTAAKLAKDILTDSEERARYERLGHDKYVQVEVEQTVPEIVSTSALGEASDQDRVSSSNTQTSSQPRWSQQSSRKQKPTEEVDLKDIDLSEGGDSRSVSGDSSSGKQRVISDEIKLNAGSVVTGAYYRTYLVQLIAFVVSVGVQAVVAQISGPSFYLGFPYGHLLFLIFLPTAFITLGVGVTSRHYTRRLHLGCDEVGVLSDDILTRTGLFGVSALLLTIVGSLPQGPHPWRSRYLVAEYDISNPWTEILGVSGELAGYIEGALSVYISLGLILGMFALSTVIAGRAWKLRFVDGHKTSVVLWYCPAVFLYWGAVLLSFFLYLNWTEGVVDFQVIDPSILQTGLLLGDGVSLYGVVEIMFCLLTLLWVVQSVMIKYSN